MLLGIRFRAHAWRGAAAQPDGTTHRNWSGLRVIVLSVGVLLPLLTRVAGGQTSPARTAAVQDSMRLDSLSRSRRDSLAREASARATRLGAVTVTATAAARAQPSSATYVSRPVIDMTPAATPWELLRQTAGVEVHEAGQGPGFASDASVRGFSSDHSTDLALWIDGVPINEPVNGHAEGYNDWSLLFPGAIRDLDVIKGPTSALYGNFALAGVVNVRTLERTDGTSLRLTGGSYGRADASLLTGYDHDGDGGAVFGLRAQHADGFRPNSGNDLTQGHVRILRTVSPNVTLDAGAELYGARWNSPGYLSEQEFASRSYDVVSNESDGGYKRHAQERLSVRVINSAGVIWRSTVYATQGRWQLYLTIPPQGGVFEGTGSQTEEEDSRYGLGLTSAVTYATPRVDVTAGVEGRFNHAQYENYFTTARTRDSADALVTGRQLSGALFVQSGFKVNRALRLELGARYDELTTRSVPETNGAATTSAGHGVFSPKLGALLHLTSTLAAYANVSRGFRSADGVLIDPTLAPITVWAYESGLKYDDHDISASGAIFRMDVSNEQTFNPLTSGSTNGGASRRQGVELDVRTAQTRSVAASVDWTFNDARYTTQFVAPGELGGAAVSLAGLRVYNTARYVGSAAVDLAPHGIADARWALRISGNWVGPYSPFDEPGVVLGAYGLLHASGHVRITPTVELDAGVRNVLDRAYPELVADHIVSPGQPRSIYLTLGYKL